MSESKCVTLGVDCTKYVPYWNAYEKWQKFQNIGKYEKKYGLDP